MTASGNGENLHGLPSPFPRSAFRVRPCSAFVLPFSSIKLGAAVRRFLRWTFAGTACAVLACGLRALWLEPASLTVTEERITLPWSTRGPLRIAILTDLHVGSPFN